MKNDVFVTGSCDPYVLQSSKPGQIALIVNNIVAKKTYLLLVDICKYIIKLY